MEYPTIKHIDRTGRPVIYRVLNIPHLWLYFLIAVMLALHFWVITKPEAIVWDETWYVNDARSIINGQGDIRPEHPAIGKLFIVLGIRMFGDSAFGWRFFSIIFGTIAIVLFYLICLKLKLSRKTTFFATFLFALDDMFFVHSSLALLDIYLLTFTLAALLLYLHKQYIPSGLMIGLSALCKLNGITTLGIIVLHWLAMRRDRPWEMLGTIVITFLSFFAFIVPIEYSLLGKFVDPIQRIKDMWVLTTINKFTNPPLSISSRPWEWLYPWNIIVYNWDNPQYYSFISWTIQLLIVPTFGYMIYRAMKGNNIAWFALSWFAVTYFFWYIATLTTNRVTYVFYFLITTPAVCLGISLGIDDLLNYCKTRTEHIGRTTRGVKAIYGGIISYFVLHLAIFIMFNPAVPFLFRCFLPFDTGSS